MTSSQSTVVNGLRNNLLLIFISASVLYRLEEQGYIEISSTEVADGRARSYYSITGSGRDYLARTQDEYREISGIFEAMMKE